MEIEDYEESEYISDNYNHIDSELFYSVTRIIGKGVPESKFQYFDSGCSCTDSQCTEENNCSCLKYGDNYRLTDKELVLVGNKFENVPVFECNFRCACFANLKNAFRKGNLGISRNNGLCPNRNVQFGPFEHLQIFDAGLKGLGLKTKEHISAGTFICEYAGEVIGLEEAKKRQKNLLLNGKMNYIFVLNEFSGNDPHSKTCVDPTYFGNIGRYINHSCQPNAAIVPIRINNVVPWLCVFATTDIENGAEICYDYSGHTLNDLDTKNENNRKLCFCGAANCKKFLPFDNDM